MMDVPVGSKSCERAQALRRLRPFLSSILVCVFSKSEDRCWYTTNRLFHVSLGLDDVIIRSGIKYPSGLDRLPVVRSCFVLDGSNAILDNISKYGT